MIEQVKKHVDKQTKSDISIIPEGLTKELQPVDVSWNKVFKTAYCQLYNEWMATGQKSFTAAGNMRAPDKQLATWGLLTSFLPTMGEESLGLSHNRSNYQFFQGLWYFCRDGRLGGWLNTLHITHAVTRKWSHPETERWTNNHLNSHLKISVMSFMKGLTNCWHNLCEYPHLNQYCNIPLRFLGMSRPHTMTCMCTCTNHRRIHLAHKKSQILYCIMHLLWH